jgi:beta-carotene ketolase (CrtW type)
MQKQKSTGLLIALAVLGCWIISTILLMRCHVNFDDPLLYLFILFQTHLYTGLFITAHDGMHGTISNNRKVNTLIGYTCTLLYAAFWYPRLNSRHHLHHVHVHTERDPDYHEGNFISWYFRFITNYLSIWQVVLMAILFNILKIWIPQSNLLLFWVLPSLLSTLQLFYFGTYLPHRGEHNNQHQSGSQPRNHLFAFLSCYFFGYHYEHHDNPAVPWWGLWRVKK